LLDTFQSQLIPLHKNLDRLPHEFLRHLQHVGRHSSREKDDLSVLRQQLEHLVNLVLEPAGQHLISFIETEYLDIVSPKRSAVDHVIHPARGTDNDLDTLLELRHVLADISAADAGVALDVHVVTESDDDFLDLLSQLASGRENEGLSALDGQVYLLEDGDGECGCLSSAGLGLSDDIVTLDDRDDGTLLNGRGPLETVLIVNTQYTETIKNYSPIGVNATKQLGLQIHVIEATQLSSAFAKRRISSHRY